MTPSPRRPPPTATNTPSCTRGAQPQISALTIEGTMHAEALGALGGDVKAQHDVATTTEGASRPTAGDSESQGSLAEEPPVGIAATGKLWSPTFGTSSSANVRGSRPRRRRQTLTWTSRASLDGFRRRFFPDDAYEHDFKLVNPSKSRLAADASILCWQQRELPGPLAAVSPGTRTFRAPPSRTSILTTATPAKRRDFTIGLYHPTNLRPGVRYLTTIRTRAGNRSSSPYALTAQKLRKVCDFSPFCVGTIPRTGESQPLIGPTGGRAPQCRLWRKGQDSRPC